MSYLLVMRMLSNNFILCGTANSPAGIISVLVGSENQRACPGVLVQICSDPVPPSLQRPARPFWQPNLIGVEITSHQRLSLSTGLICEWGAQWLALLGEEVPIEDFTLIPL